MLDVNLMEKLHVKLQCAVYIVKLAGCKCVVYMRKLVVYKCAVYTCKPPGKLVVYKCKLLKLGFTCVPSQNFAGHCGGNTFFNFLE